jgi:hypothetical protein
MIDSTAETLISLADAAKAVPRRRGGRGTHVSTLYRWATVGVRGVVLETLQIGGTKCTSMDALQRFYERLSDSTPAGPSGDHPAPGPTRRTSARRHRDSVKAGERLAEMGA